MIAKTSTRRYFGKNKAKRIKRIILQKYPTLKALAQELEVNPNTLRGVVNGTVFSRRIARLIEQAVGEKLFPYTQAGGEK
ncbi:MAG: hypothetical protein ABGX12_02740 [Desulfurobacteriaceae bacterium]